MGVVIVVPWWVWLRWCSWLLWFVGNSQFKFGFCVAGDIDGGGGERLSGSLLLTQQWGLASVLRGRSSWVLEVII